MLKFYLLRLFLFKSYIPYVKLYLKLTQYQLNIQLSSIYPKYLYSEFEPTVLQTTSVAVICPKCNANFPWFLKPSMVYIESCVWYGF